MDFPSLAPDGLSVVQVADMLNELNIANFNSLPPDLLSDNGTNCTPAFMPTPSPSPKPQPTTYCGALMQIAETPLYYFQCATNDVCNRLLCNVDLLTNSMSITSKIAVVHGCGKASTFQMSIAGGGLEEATMNKYQSHRAVQSLELSIYSTSHSIKWRILWYNIVCLNIIANCRALYI